MIDTNTAVEVLKEELEFGKEYYWKRTTGWDWFGTPRWWEIFIILDGLNGSGGYWLRENWRWNGSLQNIRTEVRTLPYDESKQIEKVIQNNIATSIVSGLTGKETP